MTKKWNKALPEIENFKLPSPALKAFPFLCFISFKPVSWYLKAITFPFQCYLHITFLLTCEHKDFLLLTNVLVWLDDLVSVQLSHYTIITFLIPFQTLGTKMYPEVVSTLSLKDLVSHLTHSPHLLTWQRRVLENHSHGRAPSMHMYKFMLNISLALYLVSQSKSFPESLHSRTNRL